MTRSDPTGSLYKGQMPNIIRYGVVQPYAERPTLRSRLIECLRDDCLY